MNCVHCNNVFVICYVFHPKLCACWTAGGGGFPGQGDDSLRGQCVCPGESTAIARLPCIDNYFPL